MQRPVSRALHDDGDRIDHGKHGRSFGHWVAHKLEQISEFRIGHGEAVAIGMAVDLTYSARVGLVKSETTDRVLRLLETLGFRLFDKLLLTEDENREPTILKGLEEFREHLGGQLTITLIQGIGEGIEVNAMDKAEILASVNDLRKRHLAAPIT